MQRHLNAVRFGRGRGAIEPRTVDVLGAFRSRTITARGVSDSADVETADSIDLLAEVGSIF